MKVVANFIIMAVRRCLVFFLRGRTVVPDERMSVFKCRVNVAGRSFWIRVELAVNAFSKVDCVCVLKIDSVCVFSKILENRLCA